MEDGWKVEQMRRHLWHVAKLSLSEEPRGWPL